MRYPQHIFREYDIRGIVGKDLTEAFAFALGVAYGKVMVEAGNATAHVGYDGRLSSPSLSAALMAGLQHAGVRTTNIGVCPTPMLYYAVCSEQSGGGIMVTGSHNPPDHNGFKIMLGDRPFFGAQIQALYPRVNEAAAIALPAQFEAPLIDRSYFERFTACLQREAEAISPLNVVWDPGNGATGEVVEWLAARLAGEHIVLNGAIDGTFPAHHPDPSEPHNLEQLIAEVRARKADIAIAFDGDGDRIGAVDAHGTILAGDQLLMLFAKDMLSRHRGATVIADVKSSAGFKTVVEAAGGVPLFWKTGHSNIKTKMKDVGALLGGEMSGHMFFAENYFGFDDALLASVRLLRILSASNQPLSAHLAALPRYVATPEIRIPCAEEKKFAIIAAIAERLQREGRAHLAIDGVRVDTPDGWWLLRASNTQAILVARAEAKTAEGLKRLQAEMDGYLGA
jgi:phosphomannomutase